MSTTLPEQGIETVHDHVVIQLADRWAKAFVCKATIKTSVAHGLQADPSQLCDIVGWYVSSSGNFMEWMAEVETEESLGNPQTVDKWRKAVTRGIPFYLLVPRGMKDSSLKMADESSIVFTYVYEYSFVNTVLQIL